VTTFPSLASDGVENPTRKIFVFGSNLAGKHDGGSAKAAHDEHGALYWVGVGLQGDSYAIPTLDQHFKKLELPVVKQYVSQFIEFAKLVPAWQFDVVKIGCGIAGFHEEQIIPMFAGAPANVILPEGW
jgi:hypothetical protein